MRVVDISAGAGGASFVYACTYTDNSSLAHVPKGTPGRGIDVWRLDPKTGQLTAVSSLAVRDNPAFLLPHPTRSDLMYASTETIQGQGAVLTLTVRPDGSLREVGRASAGGRSTCYLSFVSEALLVSVNYWDASLSLLPVSRTGTVSEPVHQHVQPGANYVFDTNPGREEHWAHRQRWPHTHCWVTEPYSRQLHFVAELGLDEILWFAVDEPRRALVPRGSVALPKGQGPRHLVFHPRVHAAFVVNELLSTVSVLRFTAPAADPPGAGVGRPAAKQDCRDPGAVLHLVQTLRTLPDDFESHDHHRSHAAEIRLHPSGRWLLVANRGHDSLAVFAVDEAQGGQLTRVAITPSGGAFPRNFQFDPSGRFIVVGNQNSNNLTVFSFEQGKLDVVDTVDQPSPNFIHTVSASALEAGANQEASFLWTWRSILLVLLLVGLRRVVGA